DTFHSSVKRSYIHLGHRTGYRFADRHRSFARYREARGGQAHKSNGTCTPTVLCVPTRKPDCAPWCLRIAWTPLSNLMLILQSAAEGNSKAAEELLPLVYAELRQLAAAKMARERPGQTLQPTALVHEVWLRLTADEDQRWENRRHFFAAAAETMR